MRCFLFSFFSLRSVLDFLLWLGAPFVVRWLIIHSDATVPSLDDHRGALRRGPGVAPVARFSFQLQSDGIGRVCRSLSISISHRRVATAGRHLICLARPLSLLTGGSVGCNCRWIQPADGNGTGAFTATVNKSRLPSILLPPIRFSFLLVVIYSIVYSRTDGRAAGRLVVAVGREKFPSRKSVEDFVLLRGHVETRLGEATPVFHEGPAVVFARAAAARKWLALRVKPQRGRSRRVSLIFRFLFFVLAGAGRRAGMMDSVATNG